jgi:hypothetical protein
VTCPFPFSPDNMLPLNAHPLSRAGHQVQHAHGGRAGRDLPGHQNIPVRGWLAILKLADMVGHSLDCLGRSAVIGMLHLLLEQNPLELIDQ